MYPTHIVNIFVLTKATQLVCSLRDDKEAPEKKNKKNDSCCAIYPAAWQTSSFQRERDTKNSLSTQNRQQTNKTSIG